MAVDLRAAAVRIAHEENVPADVFLALIGAESSWNTKARSKTGARGLTQLMPATARGLGVKHVDDPLENLRGGARYLRQQLDRFGNVRLALAAYNAGPGAVTSGKWESYPETIDYVSKVMRSARADSHAYTRSSSVPAADLTRAASPDLTAASPLAATPDIPSAMSGLEDPSARQAFEGLGKIAQGWSPQSQLGDLVDVASSPAPEASSARLDTAPVIPPPPSAPGARKVLPGAPVASPKPSGGHVAPGGGWAGSEGVVKGLAKLAGLQVTSAKRDRRYTSTGNTSDHFSGNKGAYAEDLSNGRATPQMDAAAQRIAAALGVTWTPRDGALEISKVVNGYRIQVLYRTRTGGDHFTHIHVGAKRVGR